MCSANSNCQNTLEILTHCRSTTMTTHIIIIYRIGMQNKRKILLFSKLNKLTLTQYLQNGKNVYIIFIYIILNPYIATSH